MIATHTMKINGVYHRAGEVIPSPDAKPVIKETGKYNKKDIVFMKVAKLREIAAENGVENPDEMTGGELKEILIDKLGL